LEAQIFTAASLSRLSLAVVYILFVPMC